MITIIASSPHSWITRRYVGTHFSTKLILFLCFYISVYTIYQVTAHNSKCATFILLLFVLMAHYNFLACCQWC
ncbi:hypothetical protein EI94DRAFT_1761604 [Lactarius quietus]|nr:hypothetical protein EI94DRAFT_1761604 [Lactarius quietus]